MEEELLVVVIILEQLSELKKEKQNITCKENITDTLLIIQQECYQVFI